MPFQQNMAGGEEHNNCKVMVMRRTIEIERCRFFDIEHTLARGLAGLQLRMNKLFWVIIYAIWKLTSTMGIFNYFHVISFFDIFLNRTVLQNISSL